MEVYIWCDSAFPTYGIDKEHKERRVNVPDELIERYEKISQEYKKVQEELAPYCCE